MTDYWHRSLDQWLTTDTRWHPDTDGPDPDAPEEGDPMSFTAQIHPSHPSARDTDGGEGTVTGLSIQAIAETLAAIGYEGPALAVRDYRGWTVGVAGVSATGHAEWRAS